MRKKSKLSQAIPEIIDDRLLESCFDTQMLIGAVSYFYDVIIFINLSKNKYRIIEDNKLESITSGTYDIFIESRANAIYPEQKEAYLKKFNRQSLLDAYRLGYKKVELDTQKLSHVDGKYHWCRSSVIFVKVNKSNSIYAVAFSRNADYDCLVKERTDKQRKLLENLSFNRFEYIMVIKVKTRQYQVYSENPLLTHDLPMSGNYDNAIIAIRDNIVYKAEQETYYQNAKLRTIIDELNKKDEYIFRYSIMQDGLRQHKAMRAVWLDQEKTEIFLLIYSINLEVEQQSLLAQIEEANKTEYNEQMADRVNSQVVCEYSLCKKFLFIAGSTSSFLGREIDCVNFPYQEIQKGNIHYDDIDALIKVAEGIAAGKEDDIDIDFRLKHKNGSFVGLTLKMQVVEGVENSKRFLGRIICSGEIKSVCNQKKWYAQKDALTGVLTAEAAEHIVSQFLMFQGKSSTNCLYLIDIDNFKSINDRYGYKTGDGVLVHISAFLKGLFRTSDVVARVDGDSFIVFIKNNFSEQSAISRARNVCNVINIPIVMENGASISASCSIGIAFSPRDGETYQDLYNCALKAVAAAKKHGKNSVIIYEKSDAALVPDKKDILDITQYGFTSGKLSEDEISFINMLCSNEGANIIKRGIKNKEFVSYFQPQKDLKTGKFTSVEMLSRWISPDYGIVSPGIYVPVFERNALIELLDKFMLEEAIKTLKVWQEKKIDIQISVNQSRHFVVSDNYVAIIKQLLNKYQIDASKLVIEITESCIWENNDLMVAIMTELHQLGIRIAIDDFGTGYTSLSMFTRLSFDEVKLDKIFLNSSDEKRAAIVMKSISTLCKQIGAKVVIEGVETEEHEKISRFAEFDIAQGYLYSKPITYDEFMDFIRLHK